MKPRTAGILLILLLASCGKTGSNTNEAGKPPEIKPIAPTIIMFTGDVHFDRGIKRVLRQGVYPFRGVEPILKSATIAQVNLETTVATDGIKVVKAFNFMSHPLTLTNLTNAGIDAVSLGNNHTMDYDRPALLQTLSNLDRFAIRHTGAGTNLAHAMRSIIFVTNGIRVGMLSFGDVYPVRLYAQTNRTGIAPVSLDNILVAVKELRPQVDFLMVCLHWGNEYMDYPTSYQKKIAHTLIDNGVDVIAGHHPHVLQGVEYYKKRAIFYSLGNFVFDQKRKRKTRYSMIGQVKLEPEMAVISNTNGTYSLVTNIKTTYSFIPVMKSANDYMPEIPGEKNLAEIKEHLDKINAKFYENYRLVKSKETNSYTRYEIQPVDKKVTKKKSKSKKKKS